MGVSGRGFFLDKVILVGFASRGVWKQGGEGEMEQDWRRQAGKTPVDR